MDFDELVKKRVSTRTFSPTPVPHETVQEILALAQWSPSSCNLQLTRCIVIDDPKLLSTLSAQADKKFSWAPCILLFVFDPRINRGRWATQVSLGALMQTCLLAATERGLASCPMAGFKGDAIIKRVLHIPTYMQLGLLVALGFPKTINETKDRARLSADAFANRNGYRTDADLKTISPNADYWSMQDVVSYRDRIAPVYLYSGHNRLNSFSPTVVASSILQFEECLKDINDNPHTDYLDICTYDGDALVSIAKTHPTWSIHFADHSSYIGGIHERSLPGVRYTKIDDRQMVDLPSSSVDVVSCFHKLEFTPDWEDLLREVARVLRPGGKFFFTTTNPTLMRKCIDWFRSWWESFRGTVNVYDGNPYYKIGPCSFRSIDTILSACTRAGLECQLSGTDKVPGGGKMNHRYAWGLLAKNGSE